MQTLHIDGKAKETLARAAERARQEKPLVKKTTQPGVYAVRSTNGKDWYKVTCTSETKEITCSCPARKPCLHIAAVAPIHSYIKKQEREAAQAAPAPAPEVLEVADPDQPTCHDCGSLEAFALVDGKWFCVECIKEAAAVEANTTTPTIAFCECGASLPLPGDTACADCILDAQKALFGW